MCGEFGHCFYAPFDLLAIVVDLRDRLVFILRFERSQHPHRLVFDLGQLHGPHSVTQALQFGRHPGQFGLEPRLFALELGVDSVALVPWIFLGATGPRRNGDDQ